MRRAYRRPVTDADVQVPLKFYREARTGGEFETGIEMALRAVLVSPEFLFRVEQDPAGAAPNTAYRMSDLELASRMSFFLWSSIPDDALLQVAERERLKDPAVLDAQVRRMLAALGRGLEPYDMPAIRRIVREARPDGLKLSALVVGIVNSDPFQMRRTAGAGQ
jgi:hypothetical protein